MPYNDIFEEHGGIVLDGSRSNVPEVFIETFRQDGGGARVFARELVPGEIALKFIDDDLQTGLDGNTFTTVSFGPRQLRGLIDYLNDCYAVMYHAYPLAVGESELEAG